MVKNNLIVFFFLLIFALIFSAISVYTGFEEGFFILISIIGLILIAYNTMWGFAAVLFTANLFNPSVRIAFVNIYVSNALIIITVAFMILDRLLGRREKLNHTPLELPLMLFTIFAIVTLNMDTLSIQLKRIMAYTIFTLSFLMTVNLINSRKQLNRVLDLMYYATLAGSIYIIYTFIFLRFRGSVMRGFGNFVNPNAAGEYLILVLPIIIYYAVKRQNLLYRLGIPVMVFALVATVSRAAIVSLVLAFVVINTFFKKNYWYFLGTVLFIIALLFYPPVYSRLMNIINFTDNSLLARVTLWTDALRQFSQNYIVGVGAGNFFGSALPFDAKTFNGAFNQFLTVLVEMGVIGFVLYLWTTVTLFISNLQALFKNKDRYLKNIALSVLTSVLAFQSLSMAEDPLMAIMANWAYGIILGIMYYTWKEAMNEDTGDISHISGE
ncbi:MAG: O-antigen ligase family protein [Candidatus Muiribacteriaceae bacterium]